MSDELLAAINSLTQITNAMIVNLQEETQLAMQINPAVNSTETVVALEETIEHPPNL